MGKRRQPDMTPATLAVYKVSKLVDKAISIRRQDPSLDFAQVVLRATGHSTEKAVILAFLIGTLVDSDGQINVE